MQPTDVTPETLMQLTVQALVGFLAHAERFEAEARPGAWKVISGEPVADLNYLVVTGDSPDVKGTFERYVEDLDRRGLPFACMLGTGAAKGLRAHCESAGLIHAVDWPLMVCPAAGVEPFEKDGVEVRPVENEEDAGGLALALAGAFRIPVESVRRALPPAAARVPGLGLHVARLDGRVVSTVTTTHHDRVVGIWAMGTLPEHQGKGLGKVLLSQVMDACRRRGAETFFLGATPAGQPLYEKLGYRPVATMQVWIRGDTHQA